MTTHPPAATGVSARQVGHACFRSKECRIQLLQNEWPQRTTMHACRAAVSAQLGPAGQALRRRERGTRAPA